MPIRQNRPRGDSVKTEYDESQGIALAESDEEAVETSLPRSFADGSETISGYFLWKRPVNGSAKTGMTETSRRANGKIQECRSKGSRGTRFPLAELRGGSLLSGCWGEASGAGRGQGPAQLSDGNRHLVLGITCRIIHNLLCFSGTGETHVSKKKGGTTDETHETQWPVWKKWRL